jgi:hypothetical protein
MDRTTIESRSYTGMPLPDHMPGIVRTRMPSMGLTALAGLGDATTGLTPTDLVQRLPSIVNPTPAVADPCSAIAEWVSNNTVWAIVILGGLAVFAFKE